MLAALGALAGCVAVAPPSATGTSPPSPAVSQAAPSPPSSSQVAAAPRPARFVFFFIGDGMGDEQLRAARRFRAAQGGPRLAVDGFPVRAAVTTQSLDAAITDSAAAGTALATGHKTANGVISLAPDRATVLPTIAEQARQQGLRVGLISSVSLDHATPAVFYAHRPSRKQYQEIARDLLASQVDFFGGGGLLATIPGPDGAARDFWGELRARGFVVAQSSTELEALRTLPAFAVAPELDSQAAMPYELDRDPSAPRLRDFTGRAVELLASDRGFFLMVEGGKIDWAGHANDLGTLVHEVLEFDAAIALAEELRVRRPDETLIVVTADHETGGLELGTGDGLGVLAEQRASHAAFAERLRDRLREPGVTLQALDDLLGPLLGLEVASLSPDEGATLRRALEAARRGTTPGAIDPFTTAAVGVLARRAGVTWRTRDHTAQPVSVLAVGAGQERFATVRDNTDVGRAFMAHLIAP